MSTTTGLVLRHRDGGDYMANPNYVADLDRAQVYDGAAAAAELRRFHASNLIIIPVVVTEEPGACTREVVELKGTVDLDGLKYAICGLLVDDLWRTNGGWYGNTPPMLFGSLDDLAEYLKSHAPNGPLSIVGIREVPGKPVRKVEEITPEMLLKP